MSDTDPSGGRPDTERTGSPPRPGAAAAPSGGAPGAGERGRSGPDARDGGERDGGPASEAAAEKPAREKSGSDWFAPRKAPAAGPPAAAAGGPVSGGPSTPGGGSGPAPTPPRADPPYGPDGSQHPGDRGPARPGGSALDAFGSDGPGGPRPPAPGPGARTPGPAGPTTGPVTGSSPLTPNLDGIPGLGGPAGLGGPSGPRPGGPAGPGGVPPRMSDDTAILTPQTAAPAPGPAGHVSGDTLTSGIPVVPPESRSPFPGGPGAPGGPRTPLGGRPSDGPSGGGPAGPDAPAPAPAPRPAPKAAPAPAKGRSKLVLLGAAVFVLFALAYGAGLLMNHSEVPKGTTVLGVDIGGGTKEEAVAALDAALGKRARTPLRLSVDGKEEKLAPDKAGLTLDSQETVRGAAGSDYNPVSVIGSLFGGTRPADPVIPVDEEKLGVALTDLAGISGSANDGTIRFEPNKAVAVPGKTGKALDVNRSMISVRDAYRAQVQTGEPAVVELPVATTEPTIGQAELDRAMKEFAEPAMSGLITIKAGGKQIDFGPARSLPQILSMKPVDGRLVEVYDKKAIETLLDGVFDGIMITKGDGKQHQVGADDVAHAMQGALLGKTPAERTVTIDLGGEG
ncbi:hypothetical protein [Streptomyces sp. B1I3]|uniref:hypothetical protein n=1 Tax=Streptomyces sp. B1I3 TaxID=3042264 RepID=UPI0027D88AAB|nr:hypothetical protein [Streptomyces sp. B1I3]